MRGEGEAHTQVHHSSSVCDVNTAVGSLIINDANLHPVLDPIPDLSQQKLFTHASCNVENISPQEIYNSTSYIVEKDAASFPSFEIIDEDAEHNYNPEYRPEYGSNKAQMPPPEAGASNRFLAITGLDWFKLKKNERRRVGCCWAHLTPRQKWPRRILSCIIISFIIGLGLFIMLGYIFFPMLITMTFQIDRPHTNILDRFDFLRVYNTSAPGSVGSVGVGVGFTSDRNLPFNWGFNIPGPTIWNFAITKSFLLKPSNADPAVNPDNDADWAPFWSLYTPEDIVVRNGWLYIDTVNSTFSINGRYIFLAN